MASRLLKAIVGVGIALGSEGCGGLSDAPADAAESDVTNGQDVTNTPDAPTPIDAHVDGGAATDAMMILDAFCDAPWPPTKNNGAAYVCGPTDDCVDAGYAPTCYEQAAPSKCDYQRWATYCVQGQWACATGAIPRADCKCWNGDAPDACP